jgi:predicted transposase YdaD
MLITEWNMEEAREVWQEEAREEGEIRGIAKGKAEGIAKGKAEVIALLKKGLSLEEIEQMVNAEKT